MQRQEFDEVIGIVAESQGWRSFSEALMGLWFNTASRIDEQEFFRLAMTFADTPNQKPANFMREMKSLLRRQIADSRQEPEVEVDAISDEAIRFRRMKQFRAEQRNCPYGGCKISSDPAGGSHCYCWAEVWEQPITDEERQTGAFNNPLAEVFSADGAYSVAPDPKERDVVWVDV